MILDPITIHSAEVDRTIPIAYSDGMAKTIINGETWLTSAQAAQLLGVSEGRVRQYCRAGRLGQKCGRNFLIREREAKAFSPLPVGKPPKV